MLFRSVLVLIVLPQLLVVLDGLIRRSDLSVLRQLLHRRRSAKASARSSERTGDPARVPRGLGSAGARRPLWQASILRKPLSEPINRETQRERRFWRRLLLRETRLNRKHQQKQIKASKQLRGRLPRQPKPLRQPR